MSEKNNVLPVTEEESEKMCDGDHEDFALISEGIVDTGRWTTSYDIVVQRKSDLTYWKGWCSRGSTEEQDGSEQFCEEFRKVRLVSKVAYDWELVK